jgi:hypothetical protein
MRLVEADIKQVIEELSQRGFVLIKEDLVEYVKE